MIARIAVLAGAILATSAARAPGQDGGGHAPDGPQKATFPLFHGLQEGMQVLSDARLPGVFSKVPEEIHWAPDIYEAIRRATAEDKPIFLSVHVRENADPAADV